MITLALDVYKRQGQHRQMLDQVLATFNVIPDFDLSIMKKGQTLFDITTRILEKIRVILEKERPDVVLVHGDTSTTFATALACFYLQITVGHVEAGLRTYNIYSPYPEEFNRQAVSIVSKFHFAPTKLAANHLIKEGKMKEDVYKRQGHGYRKAVIQNMSDGDIVWTTTDSTVRTLNRVLDVYKRQGHYLKYYAKTQNTA